MTVYYYQWAIVHLNRKHSKLFYLHLLSLSLLYLEKKKKNENEMELEKFEMSLEPRVDGI